MNANSGNISLTAGCNLAPQYMRENRSLFPPALTKPTKVAERNASQLK